MVSLPPVPKHSLIKIGDYVNKAGIYTKPGVIIEKKEDGSVVIDTDAQAIKQYHRHSNTTGLSPEDKDKFNSVMDQIMAQENNAERINELQRTIDDLKQEPSNKKVVQSLRNEQAQLIRLTRELPRVFNYEGDKVK